MKKKNVRDRHFCSSCVNCHYFLFEVMVINFHTLFSLICGVHVKEISRDLHFAYLCGLDFIISCSTSRVSILTRYFLFSKCQVNKQTNKNRKRTNLQGSSFCSPPCIRLDYFLFSVTDIDFHTIFSLL